MNAPKHLDGKEVLDAIAVQQGILVERAKHFYSFSHLTFQEYLTARYIDDQSKIDDLVTNHLTDRRWREVFLLLSGLARGGADYLLLAMENEIQKFTRNSSELQSLIYWANKITEVSASEFAQAAKRAIALSHAVASTIVNARIAAFALANDRDGTIERRLKRITTIDGEAQRARAKGKAIAMAKDSERSIISLNSRSQALISTIVRAIDLAIAIDNTIANKLIVSNNARIIAIAIDEIIAGRKNNIDVTINSISALKSERVFKNVSFDEFITKLEYFKNQKLIGNRKHRSDYLDNILREALLNALELTPEMIDLYDNKWEILQNYLEVNHLLIQCKNLAVRVSPQVWQGIESRMLTVPQ